VIQGVALLLLFSSFNLGIEYLANLLILFILAGAAIAPMTEKQIRVRSSVLLLLAVGAIALIPEIVCPFQASRELVSGQSYFLESNLIEAERNFNSAVQLDPRTWEAHRGLAQIAFRRFLAYKDESFLKAAIEHQQQAVHFNKLNGMLREELNRFISFSTVSS
jgi:tetratricopeptide (TPR) repeat protein